MAPIFVFGSNEAGLHGAGSAEYARVYYGAVPGQAYGLQGTSFAIPTKDAKLRPLSLAKIRRYVEAFLVYAREHQEFEFRLVPIGTGYAHYKPEQIAPMFVNASSNVVLPQEFRTVLDTGLPLN